eukprot:scaffold140188_cov33-Prasinocladus_malaysianus.AAC.4
MEVRSPYSSNALHGMTWSTCMPGSSILYPCSLSCKWAKTSISGMPNRSVVLRPVFLPFRALDVLARKRVMRLPVGVDL